MESMSGQNVVISKEIAIYSLLIAGLLAGVIFTNPWMVALLTVTLLLIATHRFLFSWRNLLILSITLLLLVPPNVYKVASFLPFDLQIDRLSIFVIFSLWGVALLIDPKVKFRKTSVDYPLILLTTSVVLSLLINFNELAFSGQLGAAIKSFIFFLSLILIFYYTTSTITKKQQIRLIFEIIIAIISIIAVFGIIERYTTYNLFRHLHEYFPFLEFSPHGLMERGGVRIAGSAEHPIALGTLFVMAIPIVVCCYNLSKSLNKQILFAASFLVIMFGLLFTASRSSVIGLSAVLFILLIYNLRSPKSIAKFALMFFIVLFLVHMVEPGALGTLRSYFLPKGGLLASEEGVEGRIGRYPIIWNQFLEKPLFGIGFEMFAPRKYFYVNGKLLYLNNQSIDTRHLDEKSVRSAYVDNQYLKLLLELGIIGTFSVLWLFSKLLKEFFLCVKNKYNETGNLLIAILASSTAFAVISFFYDTFGFVQTTYLFFILAGLGMVLLGKSRQANLPIEKGKS